MSVQAVQEPKTRLRVEIASDGTRTLSREGVAEDGPRPVDDEKLDAVAGGGTYRVEFFDGCTITVGGVDNDMEAATEAQGLHRTAIGHTSTNCTVWSLRRRTARIPGRLVGRQAEAVARTGGRVRRRLAGWQAVEEVRVVGNRSVLRASLDVQVGPATVA